MITFGLIPEYTLKDLRKSGSTLLNEGYHLYSVFKVTELLEILHKHKKIDELIYESTKKYFEDPKKWHGDSE